MELPDDRKRISEADLNTMHPVAYPNEGYPIGNGRMGTLVWTTPDAIRFQINRVDVFAVNRNAEGTPHPGVTDYGGACAQISIEIGSDVFNTDFQQHLSLYDARCTIKGGGISAACWISANDDLMVVELTDSRKHPKPIDVKLSIWREPIVQQGRHTAAYQFQNTQQSISVVQTYRELDHFCSSAVVVSSSGAKSVSEDDRTSILHLPAKSGKHVILISSASSMDEKPDLLITTEQIIVTASNSPLADIESTHHEWWHKFWSRTYISTHSPDGIAQQTANYRTLFLYQMASTSRGKYPPKWNGSIFLTDGDTRAWGSQYWVWTTEMLYWPLLAADASDLSKPYFDMYQHQLPLMQTAARQRWNAEGIYAPETVAFDGPAELPEDLVDEYRKVFTSEENDSPVSDRLASYCQYDYHLSTLLCPTANKHNGYCWISHVTSSAAEIAVHAWWHYRCTGDKSWLQTHAYPLLKGTAEFYRTYCRKGEDGLWHISGTNAHEDFWGVKDSIMDIAAMRGTIPLAIRAAQILDIDKELTDRWQVFLAELTPYPMGSDPRAKALTGGEPNLPARGFNSSIADDAWAAGFLGTVDGSYNSEDVQLTPIFPFEDWTMETSDTNMDTIANRTLDAAPRHRSVLDGAPLSTAIRSPIAAVRAGRKNDLSAILKAYTEAFSPMSNGFSLFEGVQAASIEHLGLLTMIMQESLLQSVAPHPGEPEIISVFPSWSLEWDTEFKLLARGGFEVTSRCVSGKIEYIKIHSRRGEQCRLRNCWGRECVVKDSDGIIYELDGDIITFNTEIGKTYRITS